MWISPSKRSAWNKPIQKTPHKFKVGDRVRDLLNDELGTIHEIRPYSESPDKLFILLDTGYTHLSSLEFYTKVKSNVCRSKTN
jgi:hypothetical protein